jgi:dienelactone hydrolase
VEKIILAATALAIAGCASLPGGYEHARIPSLPAAKIYDPRLPVLDLYVRKPAGLGPFPAVVFLHGCAGLEWEFAGAAAGNYLSMGYAVAILDSLDGRGLANVCNSRLPPDRTVTPGQRALDAYAALAYLSHRSDIEAKRVYLHGESHGGDTVIEAFEKNIAQDVTPLQFAGGIAYYPFCGNLYSTIRPLLILAGGQDDWTPGAFCQSRAEAMDAPHAPIRVVLYPNAAHAFNHVMRPVVYQSHFLAYDPDAAADSLKQIARFLRMPVSQ